MSQPMPTTWKIEGRANPLVSWRFIEPAWKIEDAAKRAANLKSSGMYYSTRVRPM